MAKIAVFGCSFNAIQSLSDEAFGQQELGRSSPNRRHFTASSADRQPLYLPYARFQIPFQVDPTGPEPAVVQLWVSTDDGATWQLHGSAEPQDRQFEFRAAAEGLYLFEVHTLDAAGTSFPSNSPPLRVHVDTTQPNSAIRADINSEGKLAVDVRVTDSHLDLSTAVLRLRTDREESWREIPLETLTLRGDYYESQTVVGIPNCREVAIVFAIKDQANNSGEATYKFTMPRTAAAEQDMQLASTGHSTRANATNHQPVLTATPSVGKPRSALPPIDGAIAWEPEQRQHSAPLLTAPGKLVGSEGLQLDASSAAEELPLPPPEEHPDEHPVSAPQIAQDAAVPPSEAVEPEEHRDAPTEFAEAEHASTIGQAYHCKSRAFSLDYSVDSTSGSVVADVELWGTEDGGRTWSLWGSDPDRQSPFDVQVGNDGMFGFRMVIVGANGIVSNRPKDGDSSDVWINVDTSVPVAKITRAVYGEGPESGMLVIDYTCGDNHLVERPITLSFSERRDGPWTTIATGLKNTGMYLWKADPTLPERIYLKMDVVDKAGNSSAHRLDLPIDIKGLAPRGRIQGFRPIATPEQ